MKSPLSYWRARRSRRMTINTGGVNNLLTFVAPDGTVGQVRSAQEIRQALIDLDRNQA